MYYPPLQLPNPIASAKKADIGGRPPRTLKVYKRVRDDRFFVEVNNTTLAAYEELEDAMEHFNIYKDANGFL